MNDQDLKVLTEYWLRQAQDHAYELGRQRGLAEGKEARDELLASAQRVLAWMDAPGDDAFSDSDLAALRAAIAKAEGSEA